MSKIPDVPSTENVPDGPLAWLKNWLDQVRLWVQTRDPRATRVGDPLDKFTDRRELVDLGILRRSSDGTFRPGTGFGGGSTIVIPGGGGSGGPDFSDLTPPPAPTGLTAEGGIFTLQLAWDAPIYTQGRGNGQTNIYGAVWLPGTSKPTLGDPRTKRIDSAMEASTLHAYPTQPATRWVVWIKFQTRNGVEGPPSLSAEATTGQDVSALLTILTGQIRESELYRALGDPIRSIIERSDAAAEDTVAALVAAHESGRRARAALLAEAAARGTAITEVRQVVATGDAQLASQITTLTAAVNTDRSNTAAALELEAEARANADEAEATQRSTLATQLRGGYTGTDLASVTSGLVFSERQARSTVDAAHSSRLDSLESSVDDPSTGLLARASVLETRTTAAGSGNAALADRALALEVSVNTPSTGLLARATVLEATTTDASTGNTALGARATALADRATALEASLDVGGATYQANITTRQIAQAAATNGKSIGLPLHLWNLNGQPLATVGDGKVGPTVLRLFGNPGAYPNMGAFIPIDRTKVYRVRFWARPSASATGVLYFSLQQFQDAAGAVPGPLNGGRAPYKPSVTRAAHNATYGGSEQWGEYSYTWGASDWQDGVTHVRPEFLDNYSNKAGWWEVQDWSMEEVTSAEVMASSITTLQAQMSDSAGSGLRSAIETQQIARVALDGAVHALYTVRAEVSAGGRTVAGGFGLAGTASATEGPRIDFGVRADRFWVGAPDDGSAPGIGDVQPFFIQTAPTTINGVAVPAGTYIADAFIRNGTITNVKIANAAIDDAKVANLSAAKLTAGSIAVGAYIQSTGYTGSGINEWRIGGNGAARFTGVEVSGTIYAGAGSIGGNVIDATGVQSPGYSAPTSGWRLDSSGVVRAFASSGTRVLDMAATGTAPVLKIGSALELLANGDAFFGGRLAVGVVTAAASVIATGSNVFIPNSSPAEINTGTIATHTSTGIAAFFSIAAEVQISITSTSVAFVSIGIVIKRDGATIAIKRDIIEKRQVAIFPANWKTIPVSFRHTQPAGAENYTATIDIISMDSSGAAVLPGAGSTISYNIDGWILENKV